MSEQCNLSLSRIFTRLLLAGVIMLPVLHAGQAAGDTRVRVKIVTPNARFEVVKGHRYAREHYREPYRIRPMHRHYSPGQVIVREYIPVYRVVPEWRYRGRPDCRHHHVRYLPVDRGREYGRGECRTQQRDRAIEYDREYEDYEDYND